MASTIRSIRATYLSDSGPQFGPHYRKWNESLEDDLTVNGQQLVQAEEDVLLFNADVKAFAEAVIAALEERFPEDQLMYSASVIDPSLIPSADDDIVTYGITYLADFLSEIVDQEKLEEWMRFKFIKIIPSHKFTNCSTFSLGFLFSVSGNISSPMETGADSSRTSSQHSSM